MLAVLSSTTPRSVLALAAGILLLAVAGDAQTLQATKPDAIRPFRVQSLRAAIGLSHLQRDATPERCGVQRTPSARQTPKQSTAKYQKMNKELLP